MNTFLVDFAFCPCGEMTAIQPTKLAIPDTNPQSYESVEGSIVVACEMQTGLQIRHWLFAVTLNCVGGWPL